MAEQRRRRRREWSLPIGRIAGVQLRVHVTFFLLVALFAAGSAGPEGPGLVAGLGWLALIFGCVLVHELAHSVLAKARGATVRAIVLLPIGGVSQLEHVPENWRDELNIAAVGPAASFAVAGLAACAAAVAGLDLLPPALVGGAIVRRLVWFNLMIGAFNLLPAFPLDGGRVLRAVLERTLDRETATRRASAMGRYLAVAMGLVGLVWNVWLVLIAAFVYLGASAEEQATMLHVRLRGRRVRDVMLLEPDTVDAAMPAALLDSFLRHTSQRYLPVVRDGRYVGLLDTDLVPDELSYESRVDALADQDAPTLAADAPLDGDGSALELLTESRRSAVAVVEGGRVVGLVTLSDLVRFAARSRRPRGKAA